MKGHSSQLTRVVTSALERESDGVAVTRDPGYPHGVSEKNRTALCDIAPTVAECNRPATPNAADAFLVKTRSPS